MAAVRITKVQVEEIDTDNIIEAVRRSGLSYVALSRKAGLHDQFVTRLCRGLVKEVSQEVFGVLAQAMVGEGDFQGTSKTDVLAVMRGKKSFHLRLVEDDNQPTSEGQSQNSRLDLPVRRLVLPRPTREIAA